MNEIQMELFNERIAICVESGVSEERAVEIANEQIARLLGFPNRAYVHEGFGAGFGLKKTIRAHLRG